MEDTRIIGGRYAIHAPLGTGGMSSVHIGRLLGAANFVRTVAIKQVKADLEEQPVDALLDEARLACRIHHPNVVAPLDMVFNRDEAFLVMEFVPGLSLADLLTRLEPDGRRVEPRVAVAFLYGALLGLDAAHRAIDVDGTPLEIVHRDVTPDNILLGVDGVPRLLDFGVAKARGNLQLSRVGEVKGKVGYTAPEVLRGDEADARSDVYSAAVVLWESLTGRRLFAPGRDRIEKILDSAFEPPGALVPNLPKSLNSLVMRGLEPDPDARYPSAAAFAEALEDFGIAPQRAVAQWLQEEVPAVLSQRLQLMRAVQVEAGERPSRTFGQRLGAAGVTVRPPGRAGQGTPPISPLPIATPRVPSSGELSVSTTLPEQAHIEQLLSDSARIRMEALFTDSEPPPSVTTPVEPVGAGNTAMQSTLRSQAVIEDEDPTPAPPADETPTSAMAETLVSSEAVVAAPSLSRWVVLVAMLGLAIGLAIGIRMFL
ncbi:MAG: serine/threonine-protein kinase [Myxococcota bacterium]